MSRPSPSGCHPNEKQSSSADRPPVPGEPTALRFTLQGKGSTTAGWALAQWAVARASGLQVVSVETDGRRWERAHGDEGWTVAPGSAAAGTVVVRVG